MSAPDERDMKASYRYRESLYSAIRLGLPLVLAAVFLVFTGTVSAQTKPSCGLSGGTVAASGQVRLFARSLGGRRVVYGCLNPDGPSRRLGPYPRDGWGASLYGPFAAGGPWSGGIEIRQVGQDPSARFTTALNFRTGARPSHCFLGFVGPGAPVLRTRRIFISDAGALAWSAESKKQKIIEACEGGAAQILEESGDLRVGSLKLRGHLLSWIVGSERRSAILKS